MDLKTFFENFDTIAEAPGGIQKLRSLILDLAVRGKLVPQDPKDEPAKISLPRMMEEKIEVNEKRGRRTKSKPATSDLDFQLNFELPKGWTTSELDDLCIFIDYRGKTPQKIKSGVRLITAKNVRDGFIKNEPEEYVSEETYITWMTRGFPQVGDVLFTTEAPLGKAAVVNIEEKFALAQRVINLHPLSGLSGVFLMWLIISPWFQNELLERATGMTAQGIKAAKLKILRIPLPPLAEQKRIVTKVDELMALCDRLQSAQEKRDRDRQKLRASSLDALMNAPTDDALDQAWAFVRDRWDEMLLVPADVKNYKDAILQLSLRGKFNNGTTNVESAQELIAKLKLQRKSLLSKKAIKKGKSLEPINALDVPYRLPCRWAWVRIGDILQEIKYGTSKKCSYELKEEIPVLRIPNIDIKKGSIDKSDLKFASLSQKEIEDLGLVENDLLMIRSNGSKSLVGRSAIVDQKICGYAYAGYLVRLRFLSDSISSSYIQCVLNSVFVRQQIEFPIRTTSGVKNINTSEISNLLIPLPPHEIQEDIVSKNLKFMLQCDRLETSLRQSQEKASALAAAATANLKV